MGAECSCCYREDCMLYVKDLWELSELMKEQNQYIRNQDFLYETQFSHKIHDFVKQSEEYILIFHSVPNNKLSFDEFAKIRDIVNQVYQSIFRHEEKNFDNSTKELNYLIRIKLIVSLGLKVVY